jgi:protocatechuate 3,4-dioxygenase beta subunit
MASALVSLLITGLAVCGAQTPDKAPQSDYAGVVKNPDGSPAAGCTVWSNRINYPVDYPDGVSVLEETVTDGQGRFAFRTPRPDPADGASGRLATFARDSKGRLGLPLLLPSVSSVAKPQPRQEIEIKLTEVQDCRGRLVQTSGQPIEKATIEPYYLSDAGFSQPVRQSGFLPPALAREMAAETAADGSFVLRGLPAGGSVSAKIIAAGFGAPTARWELGKPLTIQLDRPGSISGSLVCQQEPGAAAGIKLRLLPRSSRPEPEAGGAAVSKLGIAQTAKDGTFRFDEVVPGNYQIVLERDEKLTYYFELSPPLDVKPGQAVSGVTMPLRRAIAVKGKVVDQQTGQGIKDVSVLLYTATDRTQPSTSSTARTDEKGEFTVYVRPGKVTVSIPRVPEEYVRPSLRMPSPSYEVSKETELPAIELQRAAVMEGVVVDESGSPVAGAEVMPYIESSRSSLDPRTRIKTDQAGKFSLPGISPKERFSIHVRTETAVTDGPVMVDPAKGPIRLVVSAKHVFALAGTLVDDAGRPVADATVGLMTHWRIGSGGVGFQMTTATADEQGRFEFRGLWPGDEYQVIVDCKGFDKTQSPMIRGEPGKVHQLANVVLTSTRGVVEGTVVDSAGRPVAEVRVFNKGDARETVATRTDPAGRFRLEGLKSGPVYVFAEKADCRFTGVRAASGASGVQLTLLRKDEPVPPRPAPPPLMPPEEQRKLARNLYEKLWAKGDRSRLGGAIVAMARLDAEQALKWSAERGGKYDRSVRAVLAEKIADQDLDEAFSLLAQGGQMAWVSYMRLADRYVKSDATKAMRCAEEMVIQVRAMDQPSRTRYLAAVGALVIRLGNQEAGKKLIEEAAEMLAHFGAGSGQDNARGKVAVALASYDLPHALSLLGSITDPQEQDRFRAEVAVAACLGNLDQALELAGKLPSPNDDRIKVDMAYRLAPTRPADAVRVIETMASNTRTTSISSYNLEKKAMALGWVAGLVAPRDQPLACSLIDQGLAILTAPQEREYSGSYGGRAAKAAFLAVLANQIGYPDMQSVIYRVLAARPTTKNEYSPARVVESHVIVAAFLALVDPQVARDILETIEPQSEAIGSGISGVGQDAWVKAWLLVDPQRGEELFDRDLSEIKDGSDASSRIYRLVEAADLLAAPSNEKPQYIMRSSEFRPPKEED